MTFNQAIELLSREESFKATVSAMNTLLIEKGIYTQKEFEEYFCQWATAEARKIGKPIPSNGACVPA